MMQPRNKFVVVIDDEAAVREAVAGLLRSDGSDALSFASAEDFLQATSPENVGCLILDINLPGMNGLELQRYMAGSGFRRVPIIFMTGHDDRDGSLRREALQSGAHAFLSKPFLDDDLLDALRSATLP